MILQKKKNHKYSYIKHKTDTHSTDFNYTIYRINWDHHEHLCSQVKSSQVCEILFSVSVALLVCIDSIALFNYSISLRIIFGSFTREMDILVYVCTIVHPSGSTRIYEIINESDTPFNKQFSCLRKCLWAEGEHFYFVWICMCFFSSSQPLLILIISRCIRVYLWTFSMALITLWWISEFNDHKSPANKKKTNKSLANRKTKHINRCWCTKKR